ncbi:hypothetical protein VPH35_064030 [Triticum aestivum]
MLSWGRKAGLHASVKLLDHSAAFSSGSKPLVGCPSYDTNEVALSSIHHGNVVKVKVICHPVKGRSKGLRFRQVLFGKRRSCGVGEDEPCGKIVVLIIRLLDEVLDGKNVRVHHANRG